VQLVEAQYWKRVMRYELMVRRQEDIAALKSVVQVRLGRWKRMKVIAGNTWEALSFYPCPPVVPRLS
jgi:hypothetical protein